VPLSYGTARSEGVRLTMTPKDTRRVVFDPYPFDERPCRVQLCYRTLPQTTYRDLDTFRRAYFTAPVAVMEFELM
jgi:hypothetical protein